jgi:hypothetical protein|tara:strand:+ start:123 stop:1625 length:1503 start_codon:yes stop_codon:yes gene_type:complete
MDKKPNSEKIIVKNKRLVSFYSDNPSIDFEAVNLLFLDLIEKLTLDMNSTMTSTINSQILSSVNELKQDNKSIHSNIKLLSSDLNNSINSKFQDSKREYIEETKNIIFNNFSQNNDFISNLLIQNTSQLVDKTTILLNDIIPKSNETQYRQLESSMTLFQKSIEEDTKKLLNAVDKEDSLDKFYNVFETKSNNLLLQPLYSFINATEERINKNVSSINDSNSISSHEKIFTDLSDFLGKYRNSSYKGQFGENQLETVLNQLYPTGEILNTTGTPASCDFRVNRQDLPTILFETKNYDRNVTIDEVKKFIRDIDQQKCHGIFLSQHSGITSKQNYQIDIKGSNILVYVHNVDYCPNTIKIAADIIDSLSDKLSEIEDSNEIISIPQEVLDDINKEYATFIERKSKIIEYSKEFIKKLSTDVDDIKFPSLSKYLSMKCGSILNDETITCDICHQFKANSNKALAAHKRACKRKHSQINNSNIVINTQANTIDNFLDKTPFNL